MKRKIETFTQGNLTVVRSYLYSREVVCRSGLRRTINKVCDSYYDGDSYLHERVRWVGESNFSYIKPAGTIKDAPRKVCAKSYVSIIPNILTQDRLSDFKEYLVRARESIKDFSDDEAIQRKMFETLVDELEDEIYLTKDFSDVGFHRPEESESVVDLWSLFQRSMHHTKSEWNRLLRQFSPELREFVVGIQHRLNAEHEELLATFRSEVSACKTHGEVYRRCILWFERLVTSYYKFDIPDADTEIHTEDECVEYSNSDYEDIYAHESDYYLD